ncbi:MAG: hypothetical protein AB8B48_12375 [Pseudomonadales bacterium]
MKNKNIFCALCALFSPFIHASDTASANITLHIPDRLELSDVSAASHQLSNTRSAQAFFCVGDTSGLQFSIESEEPSLAEQIRLSSGSTLFERNMARSTRVDECHERNSGVLQITQLPQGVQTITAVVVAE